MHTLQIISAVPIENMVLANGRDHDCGQKNDMKRDHGFFYQERKPGK